MKTRWALGLSLALAVRAWAANYDVYLLAGQSNMDGRGKVADLTPEQRQPSATALIYYRNGDLGTDGWKPLEPGYSLAPNDKRKTLPSPTFGPELGFAQALAATQPDRKLALVKIATGGTSLQRNWNPTNGPCYRSLVETVRRAGEALTRDGHTFTVRGLLWHQGESDSADTAEVYGQRLTNFIAHVRADLQLPDLPIVVGEVIDNGKRNGVRAAQRAVAQTVPQVGFVPAEGFRTWDGGTHLDAASQLLLGQRFAAAVLGLQKE